MKTYLYAATVILLLVSFAANVHSQQPPSKAPGPAQIGPRAGGPMGGMGRMMGPEGMGMMHRDGMPMNRREGAMLRRNPHLAGIMMQMRGEMMRIRGEAMMKQGDVLRRYGERLEKESSVKEPR